MAVSPLGRGGTSRLGVNLSPKWWLLLLAGVAVYQWLLISNLDGRLFAPEALDGTFNSMLLHLLHGSAEVSPKAIGYESFTRNGHTYAYFGIVPALLRLPALPFVADPENMHLARLSCVAGATALVGLTLRALFMVHNAIPPAQRCRTLLVSAAAAFLLGGPQLFVANCAYIYNEPEIWGAVLVAEFTLIVLRAVLEDRPLSGAELCGLGALAGVAINTRPTTGVDLGLGFGLIIIYTLSARLRGRAASPPWPYVACACLFAAAGLGVAGAINQARFGNPLQFSDFNYQDALHHHPHRLAMFHRYGAFNLERLPAALLYYTTGLTVVLKHAGPFPTWLADHFDGIEGPPTSPLLTDPLWTGLALIGIGRALRRNVAVTAMLAGHVAAALILMCAMYLALRYRLDLTGLMVLPGLFGYVRASEWLARTGRQVKTKALAAIICITTLGVAGALYMLLMAKVLYFFGPVTLRCELQTLAPFLDVMSNQALPFGCRGPKD